ncbi:hypothetical protein BC938DRAFT_479836 [Jimgerdemannia flammicorona]|uniref:Uncharacterized protein n=1 Tax=Jimgerdemannia flammicorona TaxID=994334 RepID=A0A433QJZ8_9FUNG|nr:hypothetical protein BC938DRAFT_479836 [Jimgerdemannia flammicorona]
MEFGSFSTRKKSPQRHRRRCVGHYMRSMRRERWSIRILLAVHPPFQEHRLRIGIPNCNPSRLRCLHVRPEQHTKPRPNREQGRWRNWTDGHHSLRRVARLTPQDVLDDGRARE